MNMKVKCKTAKEILGALLAVDDMSSAKRALFTARLSGRTRRHAERGSEFRLHGNVRMDVKIKNGGCKM